LLETPPIKFLAQNNGLIFTSRAHYPSFFSFRLFAVSLIKDEWAEKDIWRMEQRRL